MWRREGPRRLPRLSLQETLGGWRSHSPTVTMGHNASWVPRNASEPRNTSGAEAAGANRSALGEPGEAQLYRQFTTAVQVVIFVGSLLGKPPCPRAQLGAEVHGERGGRETDRAQVAPGGFRVPGQLQGSDAGTVACSPEAGSGRVPTGQGFAPGPGGCLVPAEVTLSRQPRRNAAGGRRAARTVFTSRVAQQRGRRSCLQIETKIPGNLLLTKECYYVVKDVFCTTTYSLYILEIILNEPSFARSS
jgi:hypothetical protein